MVVGATTKQIRRETVFFKGKSKGRGKEGRVVKERTLFSLKITID